MATSNILERVEQLCAAIVLVTPSDLPELADMHTMFQDIAAWGRETAQQETVAAAAEASASQLEMVILSEADDAEATLEVVSRAAIVLQRIARDGESPDLAAFPVELGLNGKTGSGASEDAAKAALKEASKPEGIDAKPPEAKPLEGDAELLQEFIQEAREHLDIADVQLLAIETDPKESEALNAVFRAFHTIKGVAGFLALEQVQALAHEAESLLDKARKNEIELAGLAIDVTFDAVDRMKDLMDRVNEALCSGDSLEPDLELPRLLAKIRAASTGADSGPEGPDLTAAPGKKLGDVLVETGATTSDAVEQALTTQALEPSPDKVGEILMNANLVSRAQIEEALGMQAQDPAEAMLGEILVRIGAVTEADLAAALIGQELPPERPKLGELLVRSGEAPAKTVAQALRSQVKRAQIAFREPVKVDADRLDRLVDTIGELVIAESMVAQSPELEEHASNELMRHLNQLDKITRELQEMGTSLRMVPIRPIFQKMARMVRDLAKKSGKKVNFLMSGEDTELDKSVVDKIGDPLVHMVRNAVDHGIEASTEERRKAGKPEIGQVHLRAFHKGGNILIEIEDDGRGLDRDAILSKAMAQGLIQDGSTLSDREVWNLAFEPGLSTAKKVTDVSGRGVGMDVVRRNIETLRGQVEIQSETGKGSTFSIRLPLTLAIIDGMVVRVGAERFIIPTLSVVISLRPRPEDLSTVVGKGLILAHQKELIPVYNLGELLGIDDFIEDPTQSLIVVIEDEGCKFGLVADQLVGKQQIVIKSLGGYLAGTPGIAGGAIMADGNVGLILDVSGVVKLGQSEMKEVRSTKAASATSGVAPTDR